LECKGRRVGRIYLGSSAKEISQLEGVGIRTKNGGRRIKGGETQAGQKYYSTTGAKEKDAYKKGDLIKGLQNKQRDWRGAN